MAQSRVTSFRKKLLSAKTVGLDTMCFIYQFADHPKYSPLTNTIFQLLEQNKMYAVTSTIAVIETFTQPEKEQDELVLGEYEKIFSSLPNFEVVSIDWHVTRLTAKLRGIYTQLRIPDLAQISAALLKMANLFVTNDEKLKQIREIPVILLDEYI